MNPFKSKMTGKWLDSLRQLNLCAALDDFSFGGESTTEELCIIIFLNLPLTLRCGFTLVKRIVTICFGNLITLVAQHTF